MLARALTTALLLAACGPAVHGGGGDLSGGPLGSSTSTTSAPATTADEDTSADPTAAATHDTGSATGDVDSSSGGAASDTAGPLWDLGGEPDPPAGVPAWCSAKKVDFLFVIARSGFMGPVQEAIIGSLPGIVAAIDKLFADFDFQIMVVDADGDFWGDPKCSVPGVCPPDGGCTTIDEPSYPCWALKGGEITYCDLALGSGVVFPAAKGASNKRCPVPPGRRYLRRGDPQLAAAFECIGRVGHDATGSAPGKMMMALGSPELDGPYGCNVGFLRDDALLFVTLIHIGGDGASPYNPLVWANSLKATKGDDPDAIFMLGFLSDGEPILCPWADGGGQFEDFVSYFEHSLLRSVCLPNYAPDFAQAATTALDLCAPPVPE